MSSNAQDLMASLMATGDGTAAPNTNTTAPAPAVEGESDLFGDIPVADAPPPATAAPPPPAAAPPPPQDPSLIVPAGAVATTGDPLVQPTAATAMTPAQQPAAQQQPQQSSLLMQSGLLGAASVTAAGTAPAVATSASSDGLFASVEQEEAQQQQQAEAAAAAAAEQQRLQMEQQQQQFNEQMQSVYLGNNQKVPVQQPPPQPHSPYGGQQPQQPPPQPQPGMPQQQPQQHQSQMMAASGVPPVPPGSPTRIPSQPGYLTQPEVPQSPAGTMNASAAVPQTNHNAVDNFYRQAPGAPQAQQEQQQQRFYHPTQMPSTMAGMHNASQSHTLGQAPQRVLQVQKPPDVNSAFDKILVTDPLLVQPTRGLLGALGQAAPHWSYQITAQFKGSETQQHPPVWVVRRRFRHVVALEDRLHEEIPGAILPPRPDKHATRALEEATTHQSAEFAVQRAAELQIYLNQLIQHPYTHDTHSLRLFLSLQDDMGTAWPEVSSNTLTRLANVSVGAAVKVSEQTQATKFPWQSGSHDGTAGMVVDHNDYGEDNAELLALASQEQIRMASVLQAVPKLEGAIALMREYAERLGSTGMELGRLSKEVAVTDVTLGQPMDILSAGMLRSGRRNKRLALELFAALHSYSQHYKSCRYEKRAFADRRLAMLRRNKQPARPPQPQVYAQGQMYPPQQPAYAGGGYPPQPGYPPQQPQPMSMPPQQPQPYNPSHPPQPYMGGTDPAATVPTDAWQECEDIGQRLRSEINRLAYLRRTDWFAAVKVVASSYKEATTENVAIWEAVKESFLQAFPQYENDTEGLLQSQVVVVPAANTAVPPPQPM